MALPSARISGVGSMGGFSALAATRAATGTRDKVISNSPLGCPYPAGGIADAAPEPKKIATRMAPSKKVGITAEIFLEAFWVFLASLSRYEVPSTRITVMSL